MEDDRVYVSLTNDPLNPSHIMDLVRSPEAGAIVLFAGTTRNNFQGNHKYDGLGQVLTFEGRTVIHLDYEAYLEMASPSLKKIATAGKMKWGLFGVAVTHRLGRVPIGEESILIAVSAAHRREAWDAAEWILEEVKAKTEIWKRESYADPSQEPVWKENKDVSK